MAERLLDDDARPGAARRLARPARAQVGHDVRVGGGRRGEVEEHVAAACRRRRPPGPAARRARGSCGVAEVTLLVVDAGREVVPEGRLDRVAGSALRRTRASRRGTSSSRVGPAGERRRCPTRAAAGPPGAGCRSAGRILRWARSPVAPKMTTTGTGRGCAPGGCPMRSGLALAASGSAWVTCMPSAACRRRCCWAARPRWPGQPAVLAAPRGACRCASSVLA